MTLPMWLALLARNRFAMSPSRIPTAAAITAAASLNTCLAGLQSLVYGRKVRRTEVVHPPLFIIGHWRSGTTLLHELLVRDPQHTYPTTCQCFAPTNFLLTEWMVNKWLGWVMPSQRPMDDMDAGWQRPQEDEFALCNLGVPSPYLVMAYPNRGAVFSDYLTLDNLSDDDRQTWKRAFLSFVKSLTLRDDRRLVLKSPPHTGRIQTLLELFPDAKFIHLVRDPYVLLPSTIRMWQSLTYVQAIRVAHDDAWLEEFVLDNLAKLYDGFEADRSLLGPTQLVDVRYEDLVTDPLVEIGRIYNELELGDFATAAPAFGEHLDSIQGYRTNEYFVAPETRERIRRRWAGYIERYGYGTGPSKIAGRDERVLPRAAS
jgi:hypothetical protein